MLLKYGVKFVVQIGLMAAGVQTLALRQCLRQGISASRRAAVRGLTERLFR